MTPASVHHSSERNTGASTLPEPPLSSLQKEKEKEEKEKEKKKILRFQLAKGNSVDLGWKRGGGWSPPAPGITVKSQRPFFMSQKKKPNKKEEGENKNRAKLQGQIGGKSVV